MSKVLVVVYSLKTGPGIYVFPDFLSAWDFCMTSDPVWGAGDECEIMQVTY